MKTIELMSRYLLWSWIFVLFLESNSSAEATFELCNFFPQAGVDAPVSDAQGARLSGTNYLVELYGGPTADSLRPAFGTSGSRVVIPFLSGPEAGYFGREQVAIFGVAGGAFAWLQVRAWDLRIGATYEDVVARGLGGFGESALFLHSGVILGILVLRRSR